MKDLENIMAMSQSMLIRSCLRYDHVSLALNHLLGVVVLRTCQLHYCGRGPQGCWLSRMRRRNFIAIIPCGHNLS